MRGYQAATEYCLGNLPGSHEQARSDVALDYFKREGVLDPLRFIATLAPGAAAAVSTHAARA